MRRIALALMVLAALAFGGTAAARSSPDPADPPGPQPRIDHCTHPEEDQAFDAAWMANEAAVGEVAAQAHKWLRSHPDARRVAAGEWFSISRRHGAFHLAFTRDAARYERSLRRAVDHPERLCVDPAMYSLQELYAVQEQVFQDMAELRSEGVQVNGIWVEIADNALVIGLDRASDGDAAATLRRRYGTAVPVRASFMEEAHAHVGPADVRRPGPNADVAG